MYPPTRLSTDSLTFSVSLRVACSFRIGEAFCVLQVKIGVSVLWKHKNMEKQLFKTVLKALRGY
jgi:hypothetical protein